MDGGLLAGDAHQASVGGQLRPAGGDQRIHEERAIGERPKFGRGDRDENHLVRQPRSEVLLDQVAVVLLERDRQRQLRGVAAGEVAGVGLQKFVMAAGGEPK